jgi:CheY-like chemotaxis protein
MRTALVIDDNQQPADAVCKILRLFDIDARPVYGPSSAIRELNQLIPDIVFVDLNMPGVSGFEVISFMQREPRLRNVPVVVVTADDSEDTEGIANDLGVLQVLIKPASVDDIEMVLKKAGFV